MSKNEELKLKKIGLIVTIIGSIVIPSVAIYLNQKSKDTNKKIPIHEKTDEIKNTVKVVNHHPEQKNIPVEKKPDIKEDNLLPSSTQVLIKKNNFQLSYENYIDNLAQKLTVKFAYKFYNNCQDHLDRYYPSHKLSRMSLEQNGNYQNNFQELEFKITTIKDDFNYKGVCRCQVLVSGKKQCFSMFLKMDTST